MVDALRPRPRAAHRPVHQPARRVDDRADQRRRRAARRGGVRPGLPRRRAVPRPRRRRPAAPAVVLRDRRRDGVRRLRRRPGRRRRRRGRAWAARGTPPTSSRPRSPWCTPIAVDHARVPRRPAPRRSHVEKAGIIKAGAKVVVAEQTDEVLAVLVERAARGRRHAAPRGRRLRGRPPRRGGRRPGGHPARAARGSTTRCSSRSTARTRRTTPPWRWPPSRRSPGTRPLADEVVREAFGEVTSPGRLEVVRRGPTIVLDAAHNPHGAAAVVEARPRLVHLRPAGRRGRRDGRQGRRGHARRARAGLLRDRLHAELHAAVDAGRGARRGRGRPVRRAPGPRGPAARRRARAGRHPRRDRRARGGESIGSGGVLVTGSVVTVGEARRLLRGRETADGPDPARHVRRDARPPVGRPAPHHPGHAQPSPTSPRRSPSSSGSG